MNVTLTFKATYEDVGRLTERLQELIKLNQKEIKTHAQSGNAEIVKKLTLRGKKLTPNNLIRALVSIALEHRKGEFDNQLLLDTIEESGIKTGRPASAS